MLTKFSRSLTFLTSILYFVLGFWMFVMPEQVSPVFAWKVTPFMTMTIGAWCLGNAWLAWISARRWEWKLVYSALLYLWLFGIFESVVLLLFRDKLNLSHPIAWLYLAALLVNDLTALAGISDWFRLRPTRERFGEEIGNSQRGLVLTFILFVGFLGLYGMLTRVGSVGTNGGIFPEVMSLFTLRSFAVFYFALALGVLPYLWDRNARALLHHSIASYGLVVIITVAGLVYIRLFDFSTHPGGLLYFGAYLAVGIPLFFVFLKHGTGIK
jgi:hypothetical protein